MSDHRESITGGEIILDHGLKLYKYRLAPNAPGQDPSHHKALVESDVLWFAKPSTFNDMFDCRPLASLNVDVESITNRAGSEKLDDAVTQRLRLELETDWGRQSFIARGLNAAGVCCLSLDGNSNAMWGLYSNHFGYCMEFTMNFAGIFSDITTKRLTTFPYRVAYVDRRPAFNLDLLSSSDSDEMRSAVIRVLTTKGIEWEREREVRLLGTPSHSQQLSGLRGSRLILGARISELDKATLCGWASSRPTVRGPAVEICQAYPSTDSPKILWRRLPPEEVRDLA